MKHMANPDRSLGRLPENLGWIAEMYGRPQPVQRNASTFGNGSRPAGETIECIDTPGHAPHHVYSRQGTLFFCGEAVRIYLGLDDGFYLRVGAPPGGFHYPAYRRSLDTIASLDASFGLCFAHGGSTREYRKVMGVAIEQADLWMALSMKHAGEATGSSRERVLEESAHHGPGLAGLSTLPDEIRIRERAENRQCSGMKRHLPGRHRPG